MRYQTWGISRLRLFAFSLIPALAWAAFRVQSLPELSLSAIFLYYRTTIWALGLILTLASLGWVYLFRRGVFQARWTAYVFMGVELFFELFQSVQARDLLHLISALAYFGVVIALFRWLEGWVDLAAFNPKIHWFEGTPKVIPHLEVKIRTGDEAPWIDAAVRRLDHQGLFILLRQPTEDETEYKVERELEFKLTWKKREVTGRGRVVGRLDHYATRQVSGIGLLFFPKGLYPYIQYTALYESLKGEGYAF
jgi:hypothetical protein